MGGGGQDRETTLPDTVMMDTCCYTLVQTHRMYSTSMTPNVSCGLWVMMTCRCRCIGLTHVPLLMGDAEKGEAIAWGRGREQKGLLSDADNYIQYPIINRHGKEYFKKECKCIYVCVYMYV